MNNVTVEDKKYLEKTRKAIEKLLSEKTIRAEDGLDQIHSISKYFWENKENMDAIETCQILRENENVANRTNEIIRDVRRLQKALSSPYFGRITFESDLDKKKRDLYIGTKAVIDGEDFYVLDWRSPVATMFFDSKLGDTSYVAPCGKVTGNLSARKQYKIVDGKIKRAIESGLYINDDQLQETLCEASSNKMKNIVSTIQEEQNDIIRDVNNKIIIVQGGAGSGKTAVGLHRLAFLLYQDEKATSQNMLIFSPNNMFSEYISNVLPSLGEDSVMDTTFSDFASSFIKDFDHLETFSELISNYYNGNLTKEEVRLNKFKFSDEYKKALDKYILRISNEVKFKDNLKVCGVTLSKDVLNRRLASYTDMSLQDKIDEVTRLICAACRLDYKKEKENIKKTVKRCIMPTVSSRRLYHEFLISDEFEEASGVRKGIRDNKTLSFPDSIGMLYMNFELFGYPKDNKVRHLVIDEVQDYSPLQLTMIKKIFSGASITALGDVNQTVNPYFKYDSLEELKKYFGKSKYVELNKAYRSTPEIMNYSSAFASDSPVSVRDEGSVPVKVKEVSREDLHNELVHDILEMKENGFERIAVITKTEKEAKAIYEGLKDDVEGLSVICDGDNPDEKDYSKVVVPSYVSKGLEFDAVISYNDEKSPYTEEDKCLYYIASTRAQHNLVVYNEPQKIKSKKANR